MAKKSAKTVEFIVKGEDFFAARLGNGSIRVGIVACAMLDIPPGHKLFEGASRLLSEFFYEFCAPICAQRGNYKIIHYTKRKTC